MVAGGAVSPGGRLYGRSDAEGRLYVCSREGAAWSRVASRGLAWSFGSAGAHCRRRRVLGVEYADVRFYIGVRVIVGLADAVELATRAGEDVLRGGPTWL